jgi:hypothetical protein
MAVYPDRTIVEYHDGTDWVNISRYVVEDIKWTSGFASPSPDDRLAGLGTLELTLNNVDKLFTPYGGDTARGLSTLAGWKKGAKVRVRVEIKNKSWTMWVGRVADIKSDDGLWGNRRAHVICVDWMDVAARYPMKNSEILTDKTIDQAVEVILGRLSIQPEDTDLDRGKELLPAVFSNVKEKTKALSELNKLVMSELGYGYILKDGTLRIENNEARTGSRGLDKVNVHPDLMTNLELVDGDSFTLTDGELLLLEEAEEVRLTYTAEKLEMETDNNQVLNSVYVRDYPVRTDTSLVTVFSLGSPLAIPPGATVTITGRYTNPSGGSPISATNLQTPVATTDYLFNTASNGSGTNITTDLTVTATYYGDQVEYELTNGNTSLGYVTRLQARGFGIYFDSPIEVYVSDDDAIDEHGDFSIVLDQRYKRDFYAGVAYARSAIELMKDPKSRIIRARFLANINHHQMMASLGVDVGSLISLYDNRSGMTKWYYIFSRACILTLGGILTITLGCVEAPNIENGGLTPVAVEFGGDTTQDGINFGFLPQVTNQVQRSFAARIYVDALPPSLSMGVFGIGGSYLISVRPDGGLQVFHIHPGASFGTWQTPAGSISAGAWTRIAVTHDVSTPTTDPIMYIDGVPQTLTEISTPTGDVEVEYGDLVIGNRTTFGGEYDRAFDGQIADARIYNRILTSEEVSELADAAAYENVVTDGLVFQGVAFHSDLGSLDGQQLPSGSKFFENVYRNVGDPHDAPIIRE